MWFRCIVRVVVVLSVVCVRRHFYGMCSFMWSLNVVFCSFCSSVVPVVCLVCVNRVVRVTPQNIFFKDYLHNSLPYIFVLSCACTCGNSIQP